MATNVQLKDMLTLEAEPGPFISFFIPASKINNGTFNRLIITAKRSLKRQYPSQSWQPYQNKLKHLSVPNFTDQGSIKSLAIYAGPTTLRVFRLSHLVQSTCIVNDTMWIIPLLVTNESSWLHDKYQQAERHHLASRDLNTVIRLAPAGLIDTLIINPHASANLQTTLNDLAITTIGFGGQAFVLSKNETSNNVLAIRRL